MSDRKETKVHLKPSSVSVSYSSFKYIIYQPALRFQSCFRYGGKQETSRAEVGQKEVMKGTREEVLLDKKYDQKREKTPHAAGRGTVRR